MTWGGCIRYRQSLDEQLPAAPRSREPYPEDALREFASLVDAGGRTAVRAGFAVSPGLSIEYASASDRAALVAKLRAFEERGALFFGLALDDVPSALVHAGDRRAFGSL